MAPKRKNDHNIRHQEDDDPMMASVLNNQNLKLTPAPSSDTETGSPLQVSDMLYYEDEEEPFIEDGRIVDPAHLVVQELCNAGPDSLAHATLGTDFIVSKNEWSGNETMKDPHSGEEKKFLLFGVCTSTKEGTILSAAGNHYSGKRDERRFVDDKSKIKFMLNLAKPRSCTGLAALTFDSQIATLNEITIKGKQDDAQQDMARSAPEIKECLHNCFGLHDDSAPLDKIAVYSSSIYGVPPNVKIQAVSRQHITKTSLATPSSPIKSNDSNAATKAPLIPDDSAELSLGTFYDPKVLPDYGSALFRHTHAKLRQLDVCDEDDQLIGPWKWYEAFKPGNLILIEGTICCYKYNDGGKHRRLNGQSFKVVSRSDEPVEPRFRKTFLDDNKDSGTAETQRSSRFSAFSLKTQLDATLKSMKKKHD
ncbi:hypothetical protein DL96DRAFT_1722846 [Flagelloscypha sp. PMI_526]|nr:hypothetical protein DL96DRAFT_1722846 [Flagelloscypha sp. PMI_526]